MTTRRAFTRTAAVAAASALAAPSIATAQTVKWRMVTSWPKRLPGPGMSAERIAERVRALSEWKNAYSVLLYWPIKNEIDTRALLAELWERGAMALLPRCRPDQPGFMDLCACTCEDDLTEGVDFERVVELCVPRLHDMAFWGELKGRVGDPDPEARAPTSGETRNSLGRIVSWQTRPLPDGATLIAFDDITDARQLEGALADKEAALDSAERLKREFVGNVSYELRTPLTTIIGYSELLDRMGEAIPERGRSHLSAVRQAAVQLGRSIDDVLDIAAIDAEEMALDMGDVRVGDLLRETADRWTPMAEAAKVSLVMDVGEDDIGLIRGDSKRLVQTLDHLVENALRQTPPGGTVTLSAVRAAGEVRLAVSDTGRGVPFHVQAHIFDRFVGRDRGGPGLGLALVKALVELHGGWVALESEPGNGSTFTCHLPEAAVIEAGQKELGF